MGFIKKNIIDKFKKKEPTKYYILIKGNDSPFFNEEYNEISYKCLITIPNDKEYKDFDTINAKSILNREGESVSVLYSKDKLLTINNEPIVFTDENLTLEEEFNNCEFNGYKIGKEVTICLCKEKIDGVISIISDKFLFVKDNENKIYVLSYEEAEKLISFK